MATASAHSRSAAIMANSISRASSAPLPSEATCCASSSAPSDFFLGCALSCPALVLASAGAPLPGAPGALGSDPVGRAALPEEAACGSPDRFSPWAGVTRGRAASGTSSVVAASCRLTSRVALAFARACGCCAGAPWASASVGTRTRLSPRVGPGVSTSIPVSPGGGG